MITHTPNSLLQKQIKQLNEEIKIRVELINSMRIEIADLKRNQKTSTLKSADQKKIESLTGTIHTQNALISDLKQGVSEQQAKALNTQKVNRLIESNQKLEARLLVAHETIKLLRRKKSASIMEDYVSSKKKASEIADLLADALEEASPSLPVKEYIERTIHTMRKTTNISVLEHFFVQAIEGFEVRAQDLSKFKK